MGFPIVGAKWPSVGAKLDSPTSQQQLATGPTHRPPPPVTNLLIKKYISHRLPLPRPHPPWLRRGPAGVGRPGPAGCGAGAGVGRNRVGEGPGRVSAVWRDSSQPGLGTGGGVCGLGVDHVRGQGLVLACEGMYVAHVYCTCVMHMCVVYVRMCIVHVY